MYDETGSATGRGETVPAGNVSIERY